MYTHAIYTYQRAVSSMTHHTRTRTRIMPNTSDQSQGSLRHSYATPAPPDACPG